MSFNRNLEEYQDWNEKGNGLQSSAILMFGAEEPCTVCTYTCVCTQLLISKYAYIMQWGLKVRKQGVKSSRTIPLLIQETEAYSGDRSCGELSKRGRLEQSVGYGSKENLRCAMPGYPQNGKDADRTQPTQNSGESGDQRKSNLSIPGLVCIFVLRCLHA